MLGHTTVLERTLNVLCIVVNPVKIIIEKLLQLYKNHQLTGNWQEKDLAKWSTEEDLRTVNLGIYSAIFTAAAREDWRRIVNMAMFI